MSAPLTKKVLIIGWDAADWPMIEQLSARAQMPNLRRLMDRGVHADLATLEPKLSPLLWTSIATGKTADKHGILNFIEPNPAGEGVRVSSSTTRKTKALWNILTQSGLPTNVVSWYASHPAEPIRGVCVSNLFQENAPPSSRQEWPMLEGAVHPPTWTKKIGNQRMHPANLAESMLRSFIPKVNKLDPRDPKLIVLKKLLAQCYSVHRAAMAILSSGEPWSCTMAFYDSIDTIGHHFMEYHPPRLPHVPEREFDLFHNVMAGAYRLHDVMLGELLKAAGPDATVILLSDHGFYCDELRPNPSALPTGERAAVEAAWHRPFGVLLMAGPGIRSVGEKLPGASLLDIAPTALTLLGLDVGQDMDGRVLTEAFDRSVTVPTIASWDQVAGDAGTHPPEMRQDPFESQDALTQLIDLGYIASRTEDAQAMLDMTSRETRFNLSMVYQTTHRPQLAIPILEELVAQKPGEARYVLSLARGLFLMRRWEPCIARLNEFLRAAPQNLDAKLMLAAALASRGDRDGALAALRDVERTAPSERSARRTLMTSLGDVYSILAAWPDAERHYTQARDADPKNPHVLHGLARALLNQHRFEEAIDLCLNALERMHAFPEAHYLLGVLLAWIHDYPHAIQSFNMALAQQPGMVDAHRFLAMIFAKLMDDTNAARHREAINKWHDMAGEAAPVAETPMGPEQWARSVGIDVTCAALSD